MPLFTKLGRTLMYGTAIVVFTLGAGDVAWAGDTPPEWLRAAASQSAPAYDKDVAAVVLFNEEQVSIASDGKMVSVENVAMRPLTKQGRRAAVARAYYLASAGKIREIMAWLIRGDGSVKFFDKKTIIDIIADQDDVYNEGRLKVIDGSGDTEIGQVFGYTIVSEEMPLFYQDSFSFQGSMPTLVSRYSLSLPSGWKASSITFNAAEIKPQVAGDRYTWEVRNLTPVPTEPLSPSITDLTPRIAVNYSPASPAQSVNRAFNDWLGVSQWATALYDPAVIVDDNVAAKARDLTAGLETELDRIRAIGSYVQNLQYISIDIGVGHGNGYRPRSSTLVLDRGYGDCKDKANLMRAMLRALKIESYPIAIYSGDPGFVREGWASPMQFNHAIIAVKVSDATKTPTIIDNTKLGRLLIFDATDPHTPVGDLPDYLQGSLALIIAGESGGLSRMPQTPTETDLLERVIEVTLAETGEIKGFIREKAYGQASTSFRREFRDSSAGDYKKAIEGWLTTGATGARLDTLNVKEATDKSNFNLDVTFSADRYGQLMQNRLLIFKPVIVGRRGNLSLSQSKRVNPVEIDSSLLKETVVFTLPKGFVVDEMPEPSNLSAPFGKYSTTFEVKADKLYFTRSMTLNRTVVPPNGYDEVRKFFATVRTAEEAPIVLMRK